MPRSTLFLPLLACLSLGSALAVPVTLGASVGVPRGGIVPATLTVTTVLSARADVEVSARADATFGLGTTLFPAFGLGIQAQPTAAYGVVRPIVGAGATTISSVSGTVVRPYVLLGLDAGQGALSARLETVLVLTDIGPRASAALGLDYRFDLGGAR